MKTKMRDERCIPVIVGVGQLNDRAEDDASALDTLSLMRMALELADRDGGGGWLCQSEFLGIVEQMSWPTAHWPGPHKITPYLLAALHLTPRYVELTSEPSGDSPVRLLNDAANLIGSGQVAVAAVVGGEALRTESRRGVRESTAAGGAAKQDLIREVTERRAGPFCKKHGLLTPTDVYPLYENACRAAWRQSLSEAQAETAAIWSGMSAAAVENPGAWIRRRHEPAELLAATPDNRPISFPYRKLMVANNSVNQGAAVILASVAKAREMGVPEERWVYLGPGAAAHEPDDFLARDRFDVSPSMQVSIQRTLELNELSSADLDCVELYSCFPCVPKMARRVLSWPLERPHSVYGGLTFGGGPIGNSMMHAAVAMTEKLRVSGRHGLIFGNGGIATHNHCIVLRRTAAAVPFPQSYDYQTEADALRGDVPSLNESYLGPGWVETFMVPFGRAGQPLFGTVVGRNPAGERFVCRVPPTDDAGLKVLMSGEIEAVGQHGTARRGPDDLIEWQFSCSERGQ